MGPTPLFSFVRRTHPGESEKRRSSSCPKSEGLSSEPNQFRNDSLRSKRDTRPQTGMGIGMVREEEWNSLLHAFCCQQSGLGDVYISIVSNASICFCHQLSCLADREQCITSGTCPSICLPFVQSMSQVRSSIGSVLRIRIKLRHLLIFQCVLCHLSCSLLIVPSQG